MTRELPEDGQWFEFSPKDWLDDHFQTKRLKLIADAQVPDPVIAEITTAKTSFDRLPWRLRTHSDRNVLSYAERKHRVLLTLDGDIWDDRKYPLHTISAGIIYVAEASRATHECPPCFRSRVACCSKSYPT